MISKKILLTAIILILFTVSAVSAAENATDDAVSIDDNGQEIIVADEETNEEPDCIFGSFTHLNETIYENNHHEVNLTFNYTYYGDDEEDQNFNGGINLHRNVTIYGNGNTISGSNSARIFVIENCNVTFRDIIFTNANQGEFSWGGAIWIGSGGDCTAINCTFIDNHAWYGGAMKGGTAINCTFRGNSAAYGGGIYSGNAYNCLFKDNRADEDGGAAHTSGVNNCTFLQNQGGTGGAVFGDATNCIFIKNSAYFWGGALTGTNSWHTTAENCTFIVNYAGTQDSYDVYYADCKNCRFANDIIHVANYTSMYGSLEGLYMNLSYDGKQYDDIGISINIFQGNESINSTGASSGDMFNVTLMPGIYTAILSIGNSNVTPVNITLNITKIPTAIASASFKTLYYDGKYITATLNDYYGNLMNSTNLTITINGVTKTLVTTSKGQVRLSTNNLAPKTSYAATIRYAGDEIHISSTKSIKVNVVKPATKIIAKSKAFKVNAKAKKVTAILKDSRNKVLKNKWVTFRANGVNYKVKTNAKGVATATVKIAKKGTFKTLIKFAGDKYYKAVSKTINISIK